MPNKYFPFDARLSHRALGSAAMTATTTIATIDQRTAMRTAFLTKLIVEAIDVASADERYVLVIEGSNDAFTSFELLASYTLGDSTQRPGGAPDNVAGQVVDLLWTTEQLGAVYDQARIRLVISGTSPSITAGCYSTIMPGA